MPTMSTSLKRKAVVKTAHTFEQQPQKKRRTKKSSLGAFGKLSLELREMIYEFALSDEGGPQIADGSAMLIGPRDGGYTGSWDLPPKLGKLARRKKAPYVEPPLLRVSKQIRQEAKSRYFKTNNFRIVLAWGKIPVAVAWVRRFYTISQKLAPVTIEFADTGYKDTIPYWYSIAKFVFEMPMDRDVKVKEAQYWLSLFSLEKQTAPRCLAFCRMLTVVLKAKARKMSIEEMQADFRDWAFLAILDVEHEWVNWKDHREKIVRMWDEIHYAMGVADPSSLEEGSVTPDTVFERE